MLIFLLGFILGIEILQALYIQPSLIIPRQKRDIETENITFTFDCQGRAIGFYADVEHNCRIFHMCDEDGRRVPHMCANDTSFNQEYRICDWEYNFNCSEAPMWYYLNELTYATDIPPDEEYDYLEE
ncbi:uncharacterized protein LOC123670688 [Harmonia axyridis]|uniref:uncharacterized protein LOC123670688 n=1 Tax=Harmonia axyridis TaxID=115357 RepID=UPI001E2764B0|nr:uncharacterized protein LOC123670688 [Harmonia axyridis]